MKNKIVLALGLLALSALPQISHAEEGLLSADQLDSMISSESESLRPGHGGPGRPGPGRPGPGRPGPGRPGPGRPGPGPRPGPRPVECFAQNARGQTFRAVGWNARNTQREAINYCYQYSRRCRALGCR